MDDGQAAGWNMPSREESEQAERCESIPSLESGDWLPVAAAQATQGRVPGWKRVVKGSAP